MPLFIFDAGEALIGQYEIEYREYADEVVYLTTIEEDHYEVTFTVLNAEGTRIEGARVQVQGRPFTETGADGIAIFALPNGTYNYTITAQGYVTAEGSFTVEDVGLDISINLYEVTFDVTFTVTNQAGDPIAGAQISIGDCTETTDNSGIASFALPSGSYEYHVTATKYIPADGSVDVSDEEVNISLSLAHEDEVPHEVTFTIIVLDGGAPVTGAKVDIAGTTLTTDAEGKASINLVNGTYEYTVTKIGYDSVDGSVTVVNAPVVETVELSDTFYKVTFTVRGEDSKPISGAKVAIGATTKATDTDGKAEFNLINGSYNYTVTKEGYLDYTRPLTVNNADVEIDVTLIDENAVEHRVTFTVTDGHYPIQGAEVSILGDTKQTDANGNAEFALVNGDYPYTVAASGYTPATGIVTVANGAKNIEVALTPIYDITFTVSVFVSGEPLPGATVAIGSEEKTTDTDGKAIFSLENGTYGYTVSKYGYDTESGEFTVAGAAQELEVALSETEYTVTFIAQEGAEPIADAQIEIDGQVLTTDANGSAEIHLTNGTYAYEVTAFGFNTASGTITVAYEDMTESITMKRPTAFITATTNKVFNTTTYVVKVHSTDLERATHFSLSGSLGIAEARIRVGYGECTWSTSEDSMTLLLFGPGADGPLRATYEIQEREYDNEEVILDLNI